MPLHRFLNFVYAWCVHKIDPEGRNPQELQNWKSELREPLNPLTEPTERDLEEDAAVFMQTLGMVGGGE